MSKKASKKSSGSSSNTFVLEKININALERKHIVNEDMLFSSLRNSPKTKKTKIKDIFSSVENKEFEVKQNKDHIKETDNINFYISMNGKMLEKRDLEDKPIRCFHCHMDLNCAPLTVPIKFQESKIKIEYRNPTKLFEPDNKPISLYQPCVSSKDRQHKDCEKKDYFEGIGVVCSFECALGHTKMRTLCGDARFKDSYSLIAKMYFMMFKKPMPRIRERPMFSYELTTNYGGMCDEIPKDINETKNTMHTTYNDPTFKIASSIYQELKK